MKNVPRLHHYVPEGYLRRFVDDDGTLWVFDRRRQEVRRQRPEVSGAEREMYTLESETERSREVEKFLAEEIDGPGLSAIKALEDGVPPSGDLWLSLAKFVAALYVRTPAFRQQHIDFNEQMRESLLRWGVDAATASQPDPPGLSKEPGAIRTDVLLAAIERSRANDRPYQNDFVLMMTSMLPDLTDRLISLDWVIAFAPPRKSFVTCDMPTTISRPHGYPPFRGVGLLTPGTEKVVPLSSRIALLMHDASRRPMVRVGMLPSDQLRRVNEAFVGQAERFVFARSEALLRSLVRRMRPEPMPPRRIEMAGGPERRARREGLSNDGDN